jgi:hypothetical protein
MNNLRNDGNAMGLNPGDKDSALLNLERQFNDVAVDLFEIQREQREMALRSVSRSLGQSRQRLRDQNSKEVGTLQIEAILAQLAPIESAIMFTRAHTIKGLGVKARHAAHVLSQYWEEPIDQIDWDAKAIRLLIEAVCEVACMPLPFNLGVDE